MQQTKSIARSRLKITAKIWYLTAMRLARDDTHISFKFLEKQIPRLRHGMTKLNSTEGTSAHNAIGYNQYRAVIRGNLGFSFKINKEQRLVNVSFWGMLDKATILAFRRTLQGDPEFNPEFNELLEFQADTKLAVSQEDLQELKSGDSFSPASTRAVVAHSDVMFGYSRMYAIMLESLGQSKIRIFRNMDEAVMWIEGK